jgi:hypothetical protein
MYEYLYNIEVLIYILHDCMLQIAYIYDDLLIRSDPTLSDERLCGKIFHTYIM